MMRFVGVMNQLVLGVGERVLSSSKAPIQPDVPAKAFESIAATDPEQIEIILNDLKNHAEVWASTSPEARAGLLRQCIPTTLEVRTISETVTRFQKRI